MKPLRSKRMERTFVPGIQPNGRGARGLPARIQTGGCVVSAFMGAFLGDRAKGSEGVALALSWWPVVSASGVSLGCPVRSLLL